MIAPLRIVRVQADSIPRISNVEQTIAISLILNVTRLYLNTIRGLSKFLLCSQQDRTKVK